MTKADLLKYIDERLTQRSDGNIGLLMVRQYVSDNMEDYHTQNLKAYAHDFDCTIEEAEKALRIEQPSQKNDSNTLKALDCVRRQDAIDAFWHIRCNLQMMDDTQTADKMMRGLRLAENAVEQLPSVQPEVTEEAVKDYCRKRCLTVLTNDYFYKLLSAQPEIIRCKDCKYRFVDGENVRFNVCELNHNKVQSDDWFCADGERRADG